MQTTYDVRVSKTGVYKGARTTTYTVRWSAGGRPWKEPFKTAALAEAFRSELVTVARRGEAFAIETGRPMSMERARRQMSWLGFAHEYAAMKWPHLAPNSRRNTARALTNATLALVVSDRGRPAESDLRKALTAWAFNLGVAARGEQPASVSDALSWLERNTRARSKTWPIPR
jgi:hypothetical protein